MRFAEISSRGNPGLWVMLLTLATAFAMSQAFRTVAAILATPLQAEFHLSPQQLGTFAGAFHFAFGAMQLVVGIGIDLHGVLRDAEFPRAVYRQTWERLAAARPERDTPVAGVGKPAIRTALAGQAPRAMSRTPRPVACSHRSRRTSPITLEQTFLCSWSRRRRVASCCC